MTEDKQHNKDSKKTNNSDSNKPKPKFNVYWIYGIIAVVFIGLQLLSLSPKPQEISRQEFEREMLRNGDVDKIVVVNEKIANIYIKENKLADPRYADRIKNTFAKVSNEGPHFFFTIGTVENFENWINETQKKYLNH